eukprot:TRINITY_DN3950_c0_g1_i1.p1 TRINITY_DN3950_c0_g1~~TRINITY_DN3950_c0_g1_i1.p1  ORF type:complete len:199 (-),score=25.18 TRINITY_DN3950_c0_g1_i1:106-702(-)
MTNEYSFFIPDIEYLSDPQGLIRYLGQKIGIGNYCIFCEKQFKTMEAVRHHMISQSHCKIHYDGNEGEYDEFYNWGKDEEEEEGETGTAGAMVVRDAGEEKGLSAFEVTLPSGKVLGHRSLARYYKQRLRPEEKRESVLITKMMAQYKAIGWHAKEDLKTRRERARILDRQKLERLRVGVGQNYILKKYFRSQLDLGC